MALVLIVEDDNFFREKIHGAIADKGYKADTAVNGKEAIEKIKKARYDLMITDVYMDKMNGIQAISIIKTISPETQIIVITADNSIETERQARSFGIFYYLIKPFDMRELEEAVETALKAPAGKRQ